MEVKIPDICAEKPFGGGSMSEKYLDDSNHCLHTVHKLFAALTFDYAIVGDILNDAPWEKPRIDPQYKGNAFIYLFARFWAFTVSYNLSKQYRLEKTFKVQ